MMLEKVDKKMIFVVISGVSGVGKTTLIKQLCKTFCGFSYIGPVTDRALRDGETEKTFLTTEQILNMNKRGELVALNYIYGNYYGTTRISITKATEENKYPIIDWPADKISDLQQFYGGSIYTIYLLPPSKKELYDRLCKDKRNIDNKRWLSALNELEKIDLKSFDAVYETTNGNTVKLSKQVLQDFLKNKCK